MFAIGLVYATILHVCMNRGIEDRIMDAYSSGYADGEQQVKDDIQAQKDMSYEQGYRTGANDAQQGLIQEHPDQDFLWLEDQAPPFTNKQV